MKIGDFSRKYNVTIDTVRHYIELGLLVPMKKGRLFEFDALCESDLKEILTLKSLKFSLSEITSYFFIKRMGMSSKYERSQYFLSILERKIEDINNEIIDLKKTQKNAIKIAETIDDSNITTQYGFPIDLLDVLYCNKCNSHYAIDTIESEEEMIHKGDFKCNCTNKISLIDGIILCETKFQKRYSEGDITDEDFYRTYIDQSNTDFLKNLYFSIKWLSNEINIKENYSSKGTVFAEFGVGSGIFIRSFLEKLDKNDVYFAIDHDFQRLKYLKNDLEKRQNKKTIIFICADVGSVPLKEPFVDVAIDFYGSMSMAIESQTPMINDISKYLKKHSNYYGVYAIANVWKNKAIEVKNNQMFAKSSIRNSLIQNGYEVTNTYLSESVKDTHLESKSFLVSAVKKY